MMHLQEEVCPKDEIFYAMGIHLKHKKKHVLPKYNVYILHTNETLYEEFKYKEKINMELYGLQLQNTISAR